jgi:hypothetical protein
MSLASSGPRISCIVVALWLGPTIAITASAHTQAAFWREQELRFVYRGHDAFYDCGALRLKVLQVLGELGAHVSTRVDPITCHATSSAQVSSQLAMLQIRIVSPAVATAELKREASRLESRRLLLERLGIAAESQAEFPADWRSVDVAGARSMKFGSEDCELLRQLREQVLSKLALKVLAHDRSCSIQRLRRPTLKVAVLMPTAREQWGREERS